MSRYLGLFLTEAREHLENARERARALRRDPRDAEALRDLFRHAHSLKGMAATMGFKRMIQLAHALEDLLDKVREGRPVPERTTRDLPGDVLDCLARMVDSAVRGEGVDDPRARELTEALRRAVGGASERPHAPDPDASAPAPQAGPGGPGESWVRVRADLLDALLECALELMLERGRLEIALQQGHADSARRFDRCDLLLKRLYELVMELRLVPFDSAADRLVQTVEDLAEDLGKPSGLAVAGREVRLDRSVLDGLLEPLLHLLRNAVDHGIESADERAAAGKPERGRIELTLDRRSDALQVTVRDDGRGIDPDDIRRIAVARGTITPEAAAALSDAEARMLVTRPGFSTAATTDEVSGRGVGMDVVRYRVESLGGHLSIESEPGVGTEMRLALPQTLAVIQALLVRCHDEVYALPVAAVEQTLRTGRGGRFDFDPGVEVIDLADRLRIPRRGPGARQGGRGLMLDAGGGGIGLLVDEVLERREIVVRPLEPPLSRLAEYAGASLLEDGRVALVLDPAALA
jgi:two-component system chemotaxis sensor kinase CheA